MSFADKLKALFGKHKTQNEDFYDDLADVLIEGDLGAKAAVEIVDELQKKCKEEKISETGMITDVLSEMLRPYVRAVELPVESGKVNIFMVLGVNGVGKTTSVAKMAKLYADKGIQVIMSASDTFRAAAVDQLSMHGERLGIRVVKHQMGSDPSAVVFDAASACEANGGGLVIADTAGRLHNKENLVNELKKIDRIASSKASEGCYKKILVVDATTGQNALRQAEVFNDAVKIDAVVMTKYDSTAKGGGIISIGRELGLPVAFVCTGEKYPDIAPLDPDAYLSEFLGK
ncbi:MAG: signal recognition particle-docking protein FtsY [Treponema sp.]|nr:signal recognition particle-docking protein FtsY [Treponema sp.]MBQ4235364.1 signal recognition particle-docking protein FtsY [Treponema sp.]